MSKNQDLITTLKKLAFRIKKETDDGRSKGLIQSDEELYQRWKFDKFQYTEGGVTESSAHGEYITKKSWFRAFIKIEELIKKSEEYSSALELLTKIVGRKNTVAHDLERFTSKLIPRYLDDSKFSDTDVGIFVTNFLKDIKEESLMYGAEVELDGIVILPERIEFKIGDTNILLRQTRIEDLEKEFPVYMFTMQPYLESPSAILNIEFLGRQANEIQIKVEQAITILRLFKVGSVRHISYHMHSESITDVMASLKVGAGKSEIALEKSQITEEDTQRLKKFWQTIIKTLPHSFYEFGETKLDYTTIAYKRYCDALLQNGVMERRIANAVMGLEGLFLKGGETQELIYRLSIRIAKIFSLLGYDSYKVKEIVRDAYKVRSLFVHGDHLSYKEKRKLSGKYGDIRSFLLSLLDYLRISIIIMIFVKKEKEEFLDFIDDSLVDKDKDSQLNNLLNSARNVILGG
jgi:hypothetical protein